MGNCVRGSRLVLEQEKENERRNEAEAMERMRPLAERPTDCEGKRKTIYRLQKVVASAGKGSHGRQKDGVVRVRVVMTQRELQQILNYQKHSKVSSVNQILSTLKLKMGDASQGGRREGGEPCGWRPSLKSIPEDH